MAEETRLVRVEERLRIKIGRKRDRERKWVTRGCIMRVIATCDESMRESQFPGRRARPFLRCELRSGCHPIRLPRSRSFLFFATFSLKRGRERRVSARPMFR